MRRKVPVRFLGEGALVTAPPYPTSRPGPHVAVPGFIAHSAAPAAELYRSAHVFLSETTMDFDHKAFLASVAQLAPEEQRDRLIAERDRIHAELTEIKAKIAEAKIERIRSGRYADP